MANHFYVSNQIPGVRTAGGGDASARTGAFSAMAAADVYATIQDAFEDSTVAPVAGDFIYVANDHSPTGLGTYSFGVTVDGPITVLSVLETDCTLYTAGAKETATDYNVNQSGCKCYFRGIDIQVSNDVAILSSNSDWVIEDATITWTGSSDRITNSLDGSNLQFIGCTLVWTVGSTAACALGPRGGSTYTFRNCTVDDGSGTLPSLVLSQGDSGGGSVYCYECDLTAITGYIWGNWGAADTADDNGNIRVHGCKLNAAAGFVNEVFTGIGQKCLVTNSAATSAAAEYQFYQYDKGGIVQDSGDDGTAGGIYRVESTAFSAGNKVSFKCTTAALCSMGSPLMFEMPARFADLTLAGENEVTVYIATTATLNTSNTWIEVSYPDATNKHEWKTTSSRAADVLGEVTLTTDAGSDWENNGTDLTSENEYKITVTTVTGAVCVPTVRFFCTVPSITLYVDTTIDLS